MTVGVLLAAMWSGNGSHAVGQTVVEDWQPADGYLRIGPEPDRRIVMAETGYSLLVPEDPAVGVITFLDSRRYPGWGSPADGSFDAESLERDMAVLHITTGNPLDFLFEKSDLRTLATRIERVLNENGLRGLPIHFAGLSLGGTRALRLLVFLEQEGGEYYLRTGAVALVDAPLDMERLWRSEGHAISRDVHAAAADEGRWVQYLLESHLGGPPDQAKDRYVIYSPYTYGAPGSSRRTLHEKDLRPQPAPTRGRSSMTRTSWSGFSWCRWTEE